MAVTPFQFGDRKRMLYGVYHSPLARRRISCAVLLLSPFGEEAIRSYRVQKVLAERLAKAGAAVLRFDYYGTGDSAGESAEVSVRGMIGDIATAHDELVDLSGVNKVSWCAMGLGVPVSIIAGEKYNATLEKLVGWDPVFCGRRYLRALTDANNVFLADGLDIPKSHIRAKSTEPLSEAMGFEISENLYSELMELKLDLTLIPADSDVTLVGRRSSKEFADVGSLASSMDSNISIVYDDSANWNSNESLNSIIVPNDGLSLLSRELVGDHE